MTGDRLSAWDAIRFVWHSRWNHSHADFVWFDALNNVVCCWRCGRVWGDR